ncbi:vesicle transport protein SFT2B isoform X1 [Trifolium pratense]|nr:vesicle transport protein SFT2B isoform X1 [Trifolium pratense]XP_045808631.1 vesicle transport protein SFT2B isoform X1 [Trifolium pratense]XP_045808632.1 vesicle transport protein SFT2B isoform X1 [Trifolium pratense]
MWKKLGESLSGDNEEQEESWLDEDSGGLCSLSTTQRIYGFAACSIAGLALMLLVREICAFILCSMIVFAKPIKFALLFTFGNLLAVGSTGFLLGPAQQMAVMFDPVRVFATAIYLGCVVIALICALLIHSKVLTLLAIIVEIGALIWYSLSYIPFARRMVSELMIRLCDTEL